MMKTGSLLRKRLRLGHTSRKYTDDDKSTGEWKSCDCESTTDLTLASSASFSDFSSDLDENSQYISRRVIFCDMDEYYQVPSRSNMDQAERESQWYMRKELARIKIEAKALALAINSKLPNVAKGLKESYNQAKFMSESGFDADELAMVSSSPSITSKFLQGWSADVVAGEACRGLEKCLLRRQREHAISESRQIVLETNILYKKDSDCAEMVAAGYSQTTRQATLFAQSVAQADQAAIANN